MFDQAHTENLMRKVFIEQVPGNKHKQQLLEIAACHGLLELANGLNMLAKFPAAQRVISPAEKNHPSARFYPPRNLFGRQSDFSEQFGNLARKSLSAYSSRHIKEVLRQCDVYGLEHRLPMNLTPLMAAAMVGNIALVEALVERGADREATDHFGCNALHWAMREAFQDSRFAQGPFVALYGLLAPGSIDINTGQRLVRIDKHLTEYFLVQTLWVLMRLGFSSDHMGFYEHCAFRTDMVLDVWQDLPASVLRAERNKRSHLSNVLSRNEVERDYAYNRMLFKRVAHGHYQFNPALSVRRKVKDEESWVPVFEALNLRWLGQFTLYQHDPHSMLVDRCLQRLGHYLELAQLAPLDSSIIRTRARA